MDKTLLNLSSDEVKLIISALESDRLGTWGGDRGEKINKLIKKIKKTKPIKSVTGFTN